MRRGLYLTLRLVSRYGRLIRRRFTRPGLLALAALLASAVVGVDTNQTVAYQLFAILFVLVLFGMIEAWFFRSNIRVKRILPQFATAGDSFEYRVSIHNESAKTETGLALLENTVDPRPAYEVFLAGLRRKRHDVTGLRRYSVWDKWQGMIAANQPARLTEQPLPDLPAHRDIEIRPRVTTEGRGSVDFTGVTIARADRFGLFKAFAVTRQPDSLLVLPKRYPLPRLSLPGARIYQHGGMTMASSVGDSEEFLGLRDYRPGDPLKQIHWKSFARVGYPIVKEHQDEFFERHALVLDTFSEGGADRRFEEAVSVAASFAASIDTQECLLDLLFLGAETYCFTAGRGQLHTENMLEVLAHIRPCENRVFEELVDCVIERRPGLSGIILVLLGWDEPRRHFVDDLLASDLPLLALVVTDTPGAAEPRPGVRFLEPGQIEAGLVGL